MASDRRLRVTRASAAWAAWGDALGFMTELTDANGVRRRTGQETVSLPMTWRRRVGGRAGVEATLPEGTYSDDTQLRLATSRAIRGDGEFDVDSFARIELVTWQAYHLGAGLGSKAAAAAMAKSEAHWNQNTFKTKRSTYVEVGGNGAAMRIQPHVWAAPSLEDPLPLLTQVMKDAVCTHGHPTGLVGAALHAISLMITLRTEQVPRPRQWGEIRDLLRALPHAFQQEEQLAILWTPAWEQAAQRPFRPALEEALAHADTLLGTVSAILDQRHDSPQEEYRTVIDAVGGFDPATRGSGLGTAVAALALSADAEDPVDALRLAANTLQTDTDTIATMAGALMGMVIGERPPTAPQDYRYLDREAARLYRIATGQGHTTPTWHYPDPLTWNPPRAVLDLIGTDQEGELALAGHGRLTLTGKPSIGKSSRAPIVYQWAELETGQRIYVRFRPEPKPLDPGLLPPRRADQAPPAREAVQTRPPTLSIEQPTLPVDRETERTAIPCLSIDELVDRARADGYSAQAIGQAVLDVISQNPHQPVDRAAALAAVLARDLTRRK